MPRRIPRSTYRLQITPEATLDDAVRQVDYLHALGVDWVYLSPLLEATTGSDHGYDVVDHSRTDAARGGIGGLRALAAAAHGAGMGVLVDIVPNHVGVSVPRESVWWWDVLTRGRAAPHAEAFDIDWDAGGGTVAVPILGDDADLDSQLEFDGDCLAYFEHRFPIAPGTRSAGDAPSEVLARQHYRLVNFRLAATQLNYRRFFAVSSLAAIRVEDTDVFAQSHTEISRWLAEGLVDGLRVDHPDGLADPGGYLDALAALTGGAYTVVEKILEPGEELPDWACDGTTGYDALAEIDRVLVDPAGEDALSELDTALRGTEVSWPELVHGAKREVTDGILRSEIGRLARLLPGTADAIAEIAACFPVYRGYDPAQDPALTAAARAATERRPDLADQITAVHDAASEPGSEFAARLPQVTGAVMAKGVEDRAFYRYPRLVSLTEVGGDPSIFAVAPGDFHRAQQRRQATWPRSMTTLSTHDTKRGEDVRARIHVLSEIAREWAAVALPIARRLPDPVLAHLVLQTAVGAWPLSRERLLDYAIKAAREADLSTHWIDPEAAFEAELAEFVDAIRADLAADGPLSAIMERIRPAGWSNSLAAKLLQLTGPGVPDVYRGTELWSNDLVDPDNRRPFDPLSGAAALLARLDTGWLPAVDGTGAAKLLVTSRALRARRDRPEAFTDYRPLDAHGPAAAHLLAVDRGAAVSLATRLPIGLTERGGWRETMVDLPPGAWRDVITGRALHGGATQVASLLDRYPVALLLREEAS